MSLISRLTDLLGGVGPDKKARETALTGISATMDAIAPLNAHNVGGVLAGLVYDSAVFVTNQAFANTASTTGLLMMEPFTSSADLPVLQIGALVAVAFPTGQKMRVGVYKTGADGWPGDLVFDSGVIDIATAAYRYVSPTGLTLSKSEPYWLAITPGTISSGSGQFWGCPLAVNAPLAMLTGVDTTSYNVLAWPFPDNTAALPNPAPAVTSTNFKSMVFPAVKLVTPT